MKSSLLSTDKLFIWDKTWKFSIFNRDLSDKEISYYNTLVAMDNIDKASYLDLIFFELVWYWFTRDYSYKVLDVISESLDLWYISDDNIDFFKEFYITLLWDSSKSTDAILMEVLMFWESMLDFDSISDSLEYVKSEMCDLFF